MNTALKLFGYEPDELRQSTIQSGAIGMGLIVAGTLMAAPSGARSALPLATGLATAGVLLSGLAVYALITR
jgi:hypothetical protein